MSGVALQADVDEEREFSGEEAAVDELNLDLEEAGAATPHDSHASRYNVNSSTSPQRSGNGDVANGQRVRAPEAAAPERGHDSREPGEVDGAGRSAQPYSQRHRSSRSESGDASSGANLYVGNLNSQVNNRELRERFEVFGEVVDANVVLDPHTRESRCFGFVRMRTAAQAADAIENLHLKVYGGRTMNVSLSKRERAHDPTPGRFAGRKPASRAHHPTPPSSSSRDAYYDQTRPSSGSRDHDLRRVVPREDSSRHAPRYDERSSRRDDYAPRREEYATRRDDYAPRREEYPPRREEYPPRREEYPPRREEHPPRREEYTSRREDYRREEYPSRREEYAGRRDEYASRRTDAYASSRAPVESYARSSSSSSYARHDREPREPRYSAAYDDRSSHRPHHPERYVDDHRWPHDSAAPPPHPREAAPPREHYASPRDDPGYQYPPRRERTPPPMSRRM